MALGANYFQPVNPYSAIYQPAQYQPVYQPAQSQNSSQGIIWVQGESGAKSYMVAANQSVLLMDSEASTFYIKSSDSSGMPLPLRIFDYTERTGAIQKVPESAQIDTSNFVTHDEFEKFKAEVFNKRNQNKPGQKEGL